MKKEYDKLNETLNIKSDIIEVEKTAAEIIPAPSNHDDIKKDYEYTRANLYSLIEKGQEAINGIMELAGESASPRAYEVAGQLIKNVADTADKLIDLQKKLKEVKFEELPFTGAQLLERLPKILPSSNYHGDLTLENIIFTADRGFFLIDCSNMQYRKHGEHFFRSRSLE